MKRSRLMLIGAAMVVSLIGSFVLFQSPPPRRSSGFQGGPADFYPKVDLGAGTTLRENFERANEENGQ